MSNASFIFVPLVI